MANMQALVASFNKLGMPEADFNKFRFLDLPNELKEQIYALLVTNFNELDRSDNPLFEDDAQQWVPFQAETSEHTASGHIQAMEPNIRRLNRNIFKLNREIREQALTHAYHEGGVWVIVTTNMANYSMRLRRAGILVYSHLRPSSVENPAMIISVTMPYPLLPGSDTFVVHAQSLDSLARALWLTQDSEEIDIDIHVPRLNCSKHCDNVAEALNKFTHLQGIRDCVLRVDCPLLSRDYVPFLSSIPDTMLDRPYNGDFDILITCLDRDVSSLHDLASRTRYDDSLTFRHLEVRLLALIAHMRDVAFLDPASCLDVHVVVVIAAGGWTRLPLHRIHARALFLLAFTRLRLGKHVKVLQHTSYMRRVSLTQDLFEFRPALRTVANIALAFLEVCAYASLGDFIRAKAHLGMLQHNCESRLESAILVECGRAAAVAGTRPLPGYTPPAPRGPVTVLHDVLPGLTPMGYPVGPLVCALLPPTDVRGEILALTHGPGYQEECADGYVRDLFTEMCYEFGYFVWDGEGSDVEDDDD